jgi:tRNA threonylcarbamoyladenosine biosynthesis protein TsaE
LIHVETANREETIQLGEKLGRACRGGEVFALRGGLAAGKTTLTKGIAQGLSIEEDITSPTFTLINEYQGRLRLYHIDAYRLSGSAEFEAMGGEEFFYGKGVCVVEWSERLESILPKSAIVIDIEGVSGEKRSIKLEGPIEGILN